VNKAHGTVGFGCPDTIDPHHMVVDVPRGRNEPVRVVEHFGLRAGHAGTPDMIERVELERAKWTAIADPVRRVFNERLKEKDIAPGRWSVGENKLERLLGKELCVLAWAVEDAPQDLVAVAVTNWSGLKPEERWWLFTMTAAATGGVDDGDVGWRKALRFALTENPVQTGALPQRRTKKARQQSLSLFGAPKESTG
jgi:hypothetical protein